MRFERIELLRFGKFTDLRLDFPDAGLDFHVVVGANEAGKSTIRAAIADLLFGIEARSPYNFVHAYEDLRLGAVVRSADLRWEFQRLKRARQPLRDAQDRPIDDDPLRAMLGDMDRVSYERMFCLDHPRLVRGGDEILMARDDLSRLLFEASSGITGFGRLRDALEDEARSIWDRRRAKDRIFYSAAEELREAERQLKDSTVRARDWVDVERRRQQARDAFDAVRKEHEQLENRRARLERVRRVAPHLQKLRADLQLLERLADAVRLPKGARDEVDRAEMDMATADALIGRAERAVQEAQQRIEGIPVDQACLRRADEIEQLERQRIQTLRYAADIEAHRTELQIRLQEARQLARQLGWNDMDTEDELERAMPPQPVLAAIRALIQEHGRLADAVENAAQAVADKRIEIDTLSAQLEQLGMDPPPARLQAALRAAQALGDPDARIARAREEVRSTSERLAHQLLQLAPWKGTLNELRAQVLPSDSEAREHQAQTERLSSRLQALQEELQRLQSEVAQQEERIGHLERSRRPVTREALETARAERDELWRDIREGRAEIGECAEEFEARIRHADHLADLRYAGASDVAVLEHELEACAQAEVRLRSKQEEVKTLARQLDDHRAAWNDRMRAAGLPELSPLKFLDWLGQRRVCLELAEDQQRQQVALDALIRERDAAAAELRDSLEGTQGEPELGPDTSFAALVACAAERLRSTEARQAQRNTLLDQQRRAQAGLAGLKAREERARAQQQQWQEQWEAQLAAARLPAGTSPAAAAQALDLCTRLADVLKEARTLRRDRIEAMQRELDAFAVMARQLAEDLAPELVTQPPASIALELHRRLVEARSNAERLAEAKKELERHREEIERARQQRLQAEARIRPLLERSGAADIAGLRAAIERSEQLLAVEEAVEQSRRACLESGDGLSIEQLEAEVNAEDVTTIATQLGEIDEKRAELTRRREELASEITDCEAQLRSYDARADAAAAEARRQQALARMAESAERFVKVFVAARLLRWAIDRYREEKQGPLLKRAGQIFSVLTRGSFERLIVEADEKAPQLKGCRPGGKRVGVAGMSDGTRDQLYLALRLAALEMQLEQGRALPFIADDLFINFDDERSFAGFEALAELATHTQVIFLTHHRHLLPIAERAIGRPLSVTTL